jgi:hypothetical protein
MVKVLGDGREEMEEERDMIPWNFNRIQNETGLERCNSSVPNTPSDCPLRLCYPS